MAEKIVVDIEFKTNVQKISKDLESVKDSLNDTNEKLGDIADTGKSTEGALKKIGKGFKGLGLAMKTLGIGLVIEAFKFLKDIVMQNQSVMDAVAVTTETLGVVFNQITSVFTGVIDAVSDSSEGFEGLQKVIGGLMKVAITPLKLAFFGLKIGIQEVQLAYEEWFGGNDEEDIKRITDAINESKEALKEVATDGLNAVQDVVKNVGEAVTEIGSVVKIASESATEGIKEISISGAIATGTALADAKKNEELLEVMRAKQQMQGQLDAELQRQIRDDISATFQERIDANNKLGEILNEQSKKEKEIVDEKVRIAKLELDTNKESVELQVKYQQSLLEQTDLEERIAGQRSEQLTNQVALEKELGEARKELTLATLSDREQELESIRQDYEAKVELARQSGIDIADITKQYNATILKANKDFGEQDLKIQQELDDKKKAQREQDVEALSQTISMAGELFAEGTAMAKVSGVAEATINTYRAVSTALASAPPPLNFIQAGLSLVAGLKNVKEILAVKTEKPVSADAPAGTSISAPSSGGDTGMIPDLSDAPSMMEQFNTAFTQETPVRAYVVEQEVTNSQQINTMIQQKATL